MKRIHKKTQSSFGFLEPIRPILLKVEAVIKDLNKYQQGCGFGSLWIDIQSGLIWVHISIRNTDPDPGVKIAFNFEKDQLK